ncbi:MAG: peptidoglycan-binding protein [Cyanobacteria bacterium J06623_7]
MGDRELQLPDWYDYESEPCNHVHEGEEKAFDIKVRSFSGLIKNTPGCSTSACNALSQQLIHQMNVMSPNTLVTFDNLNVSLKSAAFPYVQAPAKAALAKAIQERGRTMTVNSGYRTIAQQLLLFNWGRSCGYPVVARPGRSNHQSGLAIDINDHAGWKPYLEKHGWRWFGARDRVHFDYVGAGAKDIRQATMKAFQQLWNNNNPGDKLQVDGVWGKNTERRLNNSPASGFAKAPWDEVPRLLKATTPMMEGTDIFQVQKALKEKGFEIKPDGYYGSGTAEIVKKFQTSVGIGADGVVGKITRERLFA